MKKTFIESFSNFNDYRKRCFNTIVGTVRAGLTKSSIHIENNDAKIQEYEYLEITPQKNCVMVCEVESPERNSF